MKKSHKIEILSCNLIQIIAHSHQLHPLAYYNEMNKIFGEVLEPDDPEDYHLSVNAIIDDNAIEIWNYVSFCKTYLIIIVLFIF